MEISLRAVCNRSDNHSYYSCIKIFVCGDKMLKYMEYLKMPTYIVAILVGLLLISNIIGELLELKGKVVPEIMKIRKYFKRKKREKESLAKIPDIIESFEKTPILLSEVQKLLNEVNEHYSKDNITKRDSWINWVNNQSNIYDKTFAELKKKMDENNDITLSLLIDNKRNAIIDFASKVIDEKYPVTREQFNRIFKIHKEYEDIIEKNDLINGEVDIAIRIIEESYEQHMRNHSFVEDVRGY